MTPKCNQTGCDKPAAFRFTWPGQDEAGICHEHSLKIQEIAKAMGCPIQLIPLAEPTDPPDPEAVRCFLDIRLMLNTDPKAPDERMYKIISRYLQKAREEERRAQSNRFAIGHIHECAVKAVMALAKADYIPKNIFPDKPAAIICEAFDTPAKDQCEEAAEAAWEKGKSPLDDCTTKAAFKVGFKTAWKLAKGEK